MIRMLILAAAIAAQTSALPHLPLKVALDHLRSGVIDFDVVGARDDFSASPDYHAENWSDYATAATDLHQRRPAEALKLAQDWIASHPLDSDAWAVKSRAEKDQGDDAAYDRDMNIAVDLLRAIDLTGDGLAPQSAWRVISTSEEYALLTVKGLHVDNQSLENQDGHYYDRMEVTDAATGTKGSRWFNIDRVFGHEL